MEHPLDERASRGRRRRDETVEVRRFHLTFLVVFGISGAALAVVYPMGAFGALGAVAVLSVYLFRAVAGNLWSLVLAVCLLPSLAAIASRWVVPELRSGVVFTAVAVVSGVAAGEIALRAKTRR